MVVPLSVYVELVYVVLQRDWMVDPSPAATAGQCDVPASSHKVVCRADVSYGEVDRGKWTGGE